MNGMTLIVKTATRLVVGFIVVFAAYMIFYGHLSPGGGFAGGTILACGFILIFLSFGKDSALAFMGDRELTLMDCLGAFGFFLIALIGFTNGAFFSNFIPRGTPLRLISGGTIMWSNIAIGIKVFASLYAVFLALVFLRSKQKA
ncbi:MnhB domain-containing protein [Candidatus Latescibacterota bacterium]